MTLDIRVKIFGELNLHLATAFEDLAYATYVHEYCTGRFQAALYGFFL